MASGIQISRNLVRKNKRMSKSISQDTLQKEWEEIKAAQQNPSAFRPLYERYFDAIYRFVYRRTSDQDLAGDISSQVFLKAIEKLPTYTFKGVPFSAWLFRIASNEVAQHFRDTQKNRTVSIDTPGLLLISEEMDSAVDQEQYKAGLISALNTLKASELQLIELRFFEQRSFKEVGEIMNISANNAKVRAYRIVERMKKKMNL